MTVFYKTQDSTIADTGNLGATIWDVGDSVIHGVIMDGAWDAGDQLGFKVCDTEGGTFVPLYDKDAALVTMAVEASKAYALDTQVFGAWRYIKPWSQDGSGSNAAQSGATTVTLVSK